MQKNKNSIYIIGIDEAGRGPLAGPIVIGGVLIAAKNLREERKILAGIRDSKKLSAKNREKWFKIIKNHQQIICAKTSISPKIIDRINVHQAALLGTERVFQKLSAQIPLGCAKIFVKLDGGLKLKTGKYKTIIKGDEKEPVISAASIIAKVSRDRVMLRLHKKFPEYGFDRHKGYATTKHKEAIKKFRFLEIHRKSFHPNLT